MGKINKPAPKIQKNTITKYVKKKSDAKYLEIVKNQNDDDQLVSGVDEPFVSSVEERSDVPTRNEGNSEETKLIFFIDKCKKLEKENQKLVHDNKVLKKILNDTKTLLVHKELELAKKQSKCSTKEERMLFQEYANRFTSEEIRHLRSIGKGNSSDSTFVKSALTYMYKGNLENRCVSKRQKVPGKTAISPTKKDILGEMLAERVQAEGIPDEAVYGRCSNLNRLISNAIKNVNRLNKKHLENQMTGAVEHTITTTTTATASTTKAISTATIAAEATSTATTAPLPMFLLPPQSNSPNPFNLPISFVFSSQFDQTPPVNFT